MKTETVVSFEPAEGLWDANDVAKFVKASRSWVYMKAEAGLLPCLRLGGLLRFEPAQVRAWARGVTAPVIPMTFAKRG
jgi:excisionase family DNA binding protein